MNDTIGISSNEDKQEIRNPQASIVDAGAVRFRPMALTAASVIAGSAVILLDPIFQGMAVSLMAGEVASLVLSRAAVPIFTYLLKSRQSVLPRNPGGC